MRIAFVRHVNSGNCEHSSEVKELVIPVARALHERGFFGTNVGLFCSPKTEPKTTARLLAPLNNLPDPVANELLAYDSQGKGRKDFQKLIEDGRVRSLFPDFRNGLILVTHEPVIKLFVKQDHVEYGEVKVLNFAS